MIAYSVSKIGSLNFLQFSAQHLSVSISKVFKFSLKLEKNKCWKFMVDDATEKDQIIPFQSIKCTVM